MVMDIVDRPTQLVCIWISSCRVGGGDPCGVADFCCSKVNCHKKEARSDCQKLSEVGKSC